MGLCNYTYLIGLSIYNNVPNYSSGTELLYIPDRFIYYIDVPNNSSGTV